ncbi:hypothetical protein BDV27DRAFT_168097 [Aspergillus caelatus]|uniref:Uncharacterized protein n=1 Tax=Aspergillus caelatus TaxID=61420 RepID=A0A5N6ZR97_9EURO|nr:uncharacterized protein BDV27DRAFT_168097 [Aspergillus caelatus]KAE8360094.1 hypothetical protein BDV27DRAFT_168097 [Aspergillus caelatus]
MLPSPAFQTALYISFPRRNAYTFIPMKPRLVSSLNKCLLKLFGILHRNKKLKMVSVSRYAMLHEVANIISTGCLSTGSKLPKRYEKIRKPAVV